MTGGSEPDLWAASEPFLCPELRCSPIISGALLLLTALAQGSCGDIPSKSVTSSRRAYN